MNVAGESTFHAPALDSTVPFLFAFRLSHRPPDSIIPAVMVEMIIVCPPISDKARHVDDDGLPTQDQRCSALHVPHVACSVSAQRSTIPGPLSCLPTSRICHSPTYPYGLVPQKYRQTATRRGRLITLRILSKCVPLDFLL